VEPATLTKIPRPSGRGGSSSFKFLYGYNDKRMRNTTNMKNTRERQFHFWIAINTTGPDSQKHLAFQISYFFVLDGDIVCKRTLQMRPDNYEDFEITEEAELHGYRKEKIIALAPAQAIYGRYHFQVYRVLTSLKDV
jgi:hypothetical protein